MSNAVLTGIYRPILIIALVALSWQPVSAQEHRGYMHALTELRAARWLIDQHSADSKQTADEIEAMHAIELTVSAIIKASIDDGKYFKDKPDMDNITFSDKAARLKRAVELLRKAYADINQNEDATFHNNLKGRTTKHINEAIITTQKVMIAAQKESGH